MKNTDEIIDQLEAISALFDQYIGGEQDSELSLAVCQELVDEGLIAENFGEKIQSFITSHGDKLRDILEDRKSSWNPLFRRPEVVILFMLLEYQPELLSSRRPKILGDEVFEDLAASWGVVVF